MPVIVRALLGQHDKKCAVCGEPATHFHDGAYRCNREECDKETERRHRKRSAASHLKTAAECLHLAGEHLQLAGHPEEAAKHRDLAIQLSATSVEHEKTASGIRPQLLSAIQ